MNPNPLLGVVFHWLGGLASGSFYVPYKGVLKWSWETFWLAGGMFSWLICPWIGALILSQDLFAVLHQTSRYTFWMTYLMGALWGLGGLTFGLTMRYLGMSLGMAIALGYSAAFGTLVPPIVKGEFATVIIGLGNKKSADMEAASKAKSESVAPTDTDTGTAPQK
jgi:L-rhamnose-H+ transport protein